MQRAKLLEDQESESCIHDTDKNFGPDLPLQFKVHVQFKLHEIWSVDSQENH